MVSLQRTLASMVALTACACTSPRTEILIVSDTDYRVPGELDQIAIEVRSPDDLPRNAVADLGPSEPALPRVLGLVYGTGPLGPFRVTMTGYSAGTVVVTRYADVTFSRGQTLMLRMDLLRSCARTTCGATETCGEAGCRPRAVAPGDLEPWTGNLGAADAGPG